MVLQTRLRHIQSEDDYQRIINENENVMICCGRMGPMCAPVYAAMEILQERYSDIAFYDIAFDHPDAHVIIDLPETRGFMGLPFTVYYRHGKVVKATSSIQTQEEVETILKEFFTNSHARIKKE
jgi:thioredoxin 1